MNEVVLQLVCLAQRFVLFLERPLRPCAIRHVDEGQHGLRIRQRNDRVIQHDTGIQLERALKRWPLIIEIGQHLAKQTPAIRLLILNGTGGFDRLDMRAGLGLIFGNAPQRTESRVRQANAAIRSENGNALGPDGR